jgi:signal transduction histidine kinase
MADRAPRSRRDLAADAACVALAAGVGLLLLITRFPETRSPRWGSGDLAFAVDLGIGALSCAAIWFRRRWPVGVGLLTAITVAVSLSSGMASYIAVCNVGIRRRAGVAIAMAGLHQVAMIPYYFLWVTRYPFWVVWLVSLTEYTAAVTLGMYIRARRQLVASLRERAENAEATQKLLAEQARSAERARIATEMHDVLAHRVSLMALHAGALEVRPDLPADEVRETAGLIRSTARQAMSELRDVIGVLRDGGQEEAPHAPQPTLRDIAGLVGEYRHAGLNVDLDMRVDDEEAAPGPLGRDAYRIVREALTNVSKHARGTAATVSVSGCPGKGLRVVVRNRLPLRTMPSSRGQEARPQEARPQEARPQEALLPGAGLGLVGLAERVALAGGTLSHGPDPDGNFVLTAALRWPESWPE